ncbi:hypothetical protein [Spirosoma sp. 209]|uniref:hypothetical protein n=1 Tax=Spirosoma sp. 209 TaxID=1955701 RepID=UPI0013748010|nr:hypothetical protein [Spirosoma sp. 209]
MYENKLVGNEPRATHDHSSRWRWYTGANSLVDVEGVLRRLTGNTVKVTKRINLTAAYL